MSAPVRNRSCGCCVGTRYNRHDNPPFYTSIGGPELVGKNKCRDGIPHHEIITAWRRPIRFFGKIIGYLRYKTGGEFSQYIIITEHRHRKYFPWKDVYCEECEEWHFK